MTKPENNYKERCADCQFVIEDEDGWICDLDGSLCEDVEICRVVEEYYEPDEDLEMGYDPYLGCYTDDV